MVTEMKIEHIEEASNSQTFNTRQLKLEAEKQQKE